MRHRGHREHRDEKEEPCDVQEIGGFFLTLDCSLGVLCVLCGSFRRYAVSPNQTSWLPAPPSCMRWARGLWAGETSIGRIELMLWYSTTLLTPPGKLAAS